MHVHLASLVEDLACAVAVAAAFCGLCAGAVTQRPYDFAARNLLFQEGSCFTVGLGTCTAYSCRDKTGDPKKSETGFLL